MIAEIIIMIMLYMHDSRMYCRRHAFLRAANLLCLRNVHLVHHLLLLDEHLLERVEVGLQVLQLHVIGRRGRDSGGHLNKISKLP